MPSVNQRWGVMHGQLRNINCFHLTLPLTPVHLHVYVCARVRHSHTGRSIFITYLDWGWCAPPFQGATGAPLLTGQRWMFDWVVLTSQRRSALQCWLYVCILWVPPPPTLVSICFLMHKPIALSSFQVIFFPPLSPLKRKKQRGMSWRENYLFSKSGKWFISVKWNGGWVV